MRKTCSECLTLIQERCILLMLTANTAVRKGEGIAGQSKTSSLLPEIVKQKPFCVSHRSSELVAVRNLSYKHTRSS